MLAVLVIGGCSSAPTLPPPGPDPTLQHSTPAPQKNAPAVTTTSATSAENPPPVAKVAPSAETTTPVTAPADTSPTTASAAVAPPPSTADTPSTGTRESSPSSTEPDGLVLGAGDVIEFSMFGQPDMDTTAYISDRGVVTLPLIGEIDVGGRSPQAAASHIAAAYRAGDYFTDPSVNVTVERYRSRQISVLGAVNKPGRYPLESRTSVLDALALAEGEKPTGARVVTIIRKNGDERRQQHVDLDRLVDASGNAPPPTLNAGDILYVPEAQRFYIYGEVQRPDAYALRPGMTVMQAISVGGGLTDKGSNSRIEIQRKNADGTTRRFKPELTDRIRADDVIYVKERFF